MSVEADIGGFEDTVTTSITTITILTVTIIMSTSIPVTLISIATPIITIMGSVLERLLSSAILNYHNRQNIRKQNADT